MARPKTVSDDALYAHLLATLAEAGEKSLSFGVLSRRCGLAPATLAQRFGSVDVMVRSALLAEWSRLCTAVESSESDSSVSAKGAQALLKRLPSPSAAVLALSMRDSETREAAENWRLLVEAALTMRRGGGQKGREAAALIFAAWQGRQLWESAGGKSFRLSEMLKAFG